MAEIENVSGEKSLCGGKIIERLTEEEVAVYEDFRTRAMPGQLRVQTFGCRS
jgi:hypothetical protein